jgi:hypothetical protein
MIAASPVLPSATTPPPMIVGGGRPGDANGALLPAGEVLAHIFESGAVDSEERPGTITALGWEILQGPLQGRTLWTREDASRATGQRNLARIREVAGVGPIANTDELHFKPMLINIVHVGEMDGDGKYGPKPAIRAYKFYGPPGSAPAPPQTRNDAIELPAPPPVAVTVVRAASNPSAPQELPEELTRVPGLVGGITEWISASAISPQRGLALGAALTLVGTAAGRKIAGPTNSGTHLYVLGIARTGAGKDHPLSATATVLEAAGMTAHIGPAQFMSMSAVFSALTREPLMLAAIDEFGSFLARVNDKKSGGHEKAISGVWRSAWGKSFKTLPPMEWAGRTSAPIYSPALSIFGMSTPQEFYASIQGADISNGFLNRFLTISTDIVPDEVDPTCSAFEVPEPITSAMMGIYSAGGPLLGATSHNARSNAPAIVVPWDDDQAKHVYDTFRLALKVRESDAAFLARTAEMAVRLATIRAIGINYHHPRLTVEDMEWGRDLALWSAERMMADAGDYMAENDYQRSYNAVKRVISDSPGITRRSFMQKMKGRIPTVTLNGILDALIESGEIHWVHGPTPEMGGRKPEIYWPGPDPRGGTYPRPSQSNRG